MGVNVHMLRPEEVGQWAHAESRLAGGRTLFWRGREQKEVDHFLLPGLHPNNKLFLLPTKESKHSPFRPYGQGGVFLRNEFVFLAQGEGPLRTVGGLKGVSSYKDGWGQDEERASTQRNSRCTHFRCGRWEGNPWSVTEGWVLSPVPEKNPKEDRGTVLRHGSSSRLEGSSQAQRKKLPHGTRCAHHVLSICLHQVLSVDLSTTAALLKSSLNFRDGKPEKNIPPADLSPFWFTFHQWEALECDLESARKEKSSFSFRSSKSMHGQMPNIQVRENKFRSGAAGTTDGSGLSWLPLLSSS